MSVICVEILSFFERKDKKVVVNHRNQQICFFKIVQVHPDNKIMSGTKNRERENNGGT